MKKKIYAILFVCAFTAPLYAVKLFDATDELSEEAVEFYHQNGFVAIKNFLPEEQCDEMREEAHRIVEEFDPSEHLSVFSAEKKERTQPLDNYFMESGDKVRCFLETCAVKDGKLVMEKDRAVNKIGHALHDQNPVFKSATCTKRAVQYALAIGLTNPRVAQSMYIFKSPGVGGAVDPHRDEMFLNTQPHTLTGFWTALEDADETNACMWAVPGSHEAPLAQRFIVDKEGNQKVIDIAQKTEWGEKDFVSLAVPKATLIILHGMLMHKSGTNTSERSREAYTFHAFSADSDYKSDNWLQRDEFPRLEVE